MAPRRGRHRAKPAKKAPMTRALVIGGLCGACAAGAAGVLANLGTSAPSTAAPAVHVASSAQPSGLNSSSGSSSTTSATASATKAQPVKASPSAKPSPKSKSKPQFSGPISVVALGDSVTAGTGSHSFVNDVATTLAANYKTTARVTNFAADGEATTGLIHDVQYSSRQAALAKADVVVIQIGANDFDESQAQNPGCAPVRTSGCYSAPMATMRSNLAQIVSTVKAVAKPNAKIVLLGYWNVFKDGFNGSARGTDYVKQGEALARWVNVQMSATASAQHTIYADGYMPFMQVANIQDYLEADGDHPNNAGQRLLAKSVLSALGEPAKLAG